MKKRSERRKHCALVVVRRSQKFRPATDPFPGTQDGQNLISWRWSLPLPTNPLADRRSDLCKSLFKKTYFTKLVAFIIYYRPTYC